MGVRWCLLCVFLVGSPLRSVTYLCNILWPNTTLWPPLQPQPHHKLREIFLLITWLQYFDDYSMDRDGSDQPILVNFNTWWLTAIGSPDTQDTQHWALTGWQRAQFLMMISCIICQYCGTMVWYRVVFVPSNKSHYKLGTQQCLVTSWAIIRLLQSLPAHSSGWCSLLLSGSSSSYSSNVRTGKLS